MRKSKVSVLTGFARDYIVEHPDAETMEIIEAGRKRGMKLWYRNVGDARRLLGPKPNGTKAAKNGAAEKPIDGAVDPVVRELNNQIAILGAAIERRKAALAILNDGVVTDTK